MLHLKGFPSSLRGFIYSIRTNVKLGQRGFLKFSEVDSFDEFEYYPCNVEWAPMVA